MINQLHSRILASIGLLFAFGQDSNSRVLYPEVESEARIILRETVHLITFVKDPVDILLIPSIHVAMREYLSAKGNLQVDYLLFTPENPVKGYHLQPDLYSLKKSTFNPNSQTAVLNFGFTVKLSPFNKFFDIKDRLLEEGYYNVIIVNWTNLNQGNYVEAATNAVLVGLETSNLLHYLMDKTGIQPDSIYAVGHSLGAIISSFIGKSLDGLQRITLLDSAGPGFQFLSPSLRPNCSDALYVDVIHTNGATTYLQGEGTLGNIGCIDFYPNGGSSQTGCRIGNYYTDVDNTRHFIDSDSTIKYCNHNRAVDLFYTSISECRFLATQCFVFEAYEDGICKWNHKAEMGFHSRPRNPSPDRSMFYVKTSGAYPFC